MHFTDPRELGDLQVIGVTVAAVHTMVLDGSGCSHNFVLVSQRLRILTVGACIQDPSQGGTGGRAALDARSWILMIVQGGNRSGSGNSEMV